MDEGRASVTPLTVLRNSESAWMVLPRLKNINMLGLGRSIGTPPEGIRAEVLVVKDFDDLAQNAALAAGRIVLYNLNFTSYGELSVYRGRGSAEAAKVGAVASLMSSLASFSIDSPHTGDQFLSQDDPLIPAAAISVEDASMMGRMQERGETIEVLLTMGAVNYAENISRNVIMELQGSEFPQETVVVSGHIDSWDVGQGAMDDGGGVMISWNAAVVLKRLGLIPRRTLRVIFFTAEEQGLIGGEAYFNAHESEKDNFQIIMESDGGTFNPTALAFKGNIEATCIMQEILKLLAPLNITEVLPGGGGPDIGNWGRVGVPLGNIHLHYLHTKGFWQENVNQNLNIGFS
ncbi:hypothetical protein SK128_013769 [Halocaridina rubra]|uniref:Carboxypeptidase Q n=1 Tax=Halocaridina rubra TaxID=373956 RepID=A0AAN8WHR7_HALRR